MKALTYRRFAVLALLALFALPCWASEIAVLRNGFEIRHERREVVGSMTRLYVSADGSYVDVPTIEIEHFEAAPDVITPVTPTESTSGVLANPARETKNELRRNPADLNQVVNEASDRYRLDPDLVKSVIKAESGFNVRARSAKGAQGLMQLMPGTASQLGVPDAFDPAANVEGGTRYLRELLERYNFDLVKALAAYNAGPMRVEQYGGVPPYYETRAYVSRIVKDFNKKKVAEKSVSPERSGLNPGSKPSKPGSKPASKSSPATAQSGISKPDKAATGPRKSSSSSGSKSSLALASD